MDGVGPMEPSVGLVFRSYPTFRAILSKGFATQGEFCLWQRPSRAVKSRKADSSPKTGNHDGPALRFTTATRRGRPVLP